MAFGTTWGATLAAASGEPNWVITRAEIRSRQNDSDQRRRLDCETTLPASVFVTAEDLRLSSARDALSSVFAPVWAEEPDCRSADPASDFCSGLALLL